MYYIPCGEVEMQTENNKTYNTAICNNDFITMFLPSSAKQPAALAALSFSCILNFTPPPPPPPRQEES